MVRLSSKHRCNPYINVIGKDKLIEETRIKRGNEQDSFNAIQADFYHIGSEIARCEKDIEHSEQTESSRLKSIDEVIQSIHLFVVSAADGLTLQDHEICKMLRKLDR